MKSYWFLWIILIVTGGCSPAGKCNWAPNDQPPVRILFIGNSYTYTNDLPGMFTQLACAGGYKVETDIAAQGGWTLSQHAADSQTLKKLDQKKWDIVVLQEQSGIPAIPASRTQSMSPAVRLLVGKIRETGAQPLLFMTWGYRDGSDQTGFPNYRDMQAQVYAGYMEIGRELGAAVAPVGAAWFQAVTQPDPIDLWQSDGSHPNPSGTYLAACVFYAMIFHQSPLGLAYSAGLSQPTAQRLQTLAADSVFNAAR